MSQYIDFSEYHHCISTMPLFQSLTLEQIQLIQNKITEKELQTGDMLYQAGEETNTLYLVQSGLLRTYRLSSSGKEQHIRTLEAGDFVGEMALFSGRKYNRYIQAAETTMVCCIKQADFKEIVSANPNIALELLAVLADRLDNSERQITAITSETVGTRIAKYLWNEYLNQKSVKIMLSSTKKNIASYLGMSPESFSRQLTKLTKENIITQPAPNMIKILDTAYLERLAHSQIK